MSETLLFVFQIMLTVIVFHQKTAPWSSGVGSGLWGALGELWEILGEPWDTLGHLWETFGELSSPRPAAPHLPPSPPPAPAPRPVRPPCARPARGPRPAEETQGPGPVQGDCLGAARELRGGGEGPGGFTIYPNSRSTAKRTLCYGRSGGGRLTGSGGLGGEAPQWKGSSYIVFIYTRTPGLLSHT